MPLFTETKEELKGYLQVYVLTGTESVIVRLMPTLEAPEDIAKCIKYHGTVSLLKVLPEAVYTVITRRYSTFESVTWWSSSGHRVEGMLRYY